MQNIETQSSEEVAAKIKEIKEKATEHFSKILKKVPSEQIVERLQNVLQKQTGSELKDLKQLQIIKELTEDAPEEFKDRIAEVGEKLLNLMEALRTRTTLP